MGNKQRSIIRQELTQRREEGCDIRSIEGRIRAALEDPDGTKDSEYEALYDGLDSLEPVSSFPYEEPSTLSAIRPLRPEGPRQMGVEHSDDDLLDRIHGAWLGRCGRLRAGQACGGLAESEDRQLPLVHQRSSPG